jgi:glycosyltransferase involved in cell wall biosynthesis
MIFSATRPAEFCLDSRRKPFQAVAVIDPTNCAAVIPCFNESASIAPLVAAVRRQLPFVLVVDDGSTDATASVAENAGAAVVRHDRNLGKGAALKTGLARALQRGCEWAVTLDGDGQHAPADLPALVRCAEATGARLVIGNRMNEAQKIPWLRRQVNRWMSRKISQRAGRQLPDTQSGFRLVHLRTWSALALRAQHFEIESEMLLAFLAAGRRVEFVPVQVIRSGRGSHICPLADSLRWWRWWRNFGGSPTLSEPKSSAMPAALRAAARTEMLR